MTRVFRTASLVVGFAACGCTTGSDTQPASVAAARGDEAAPTRGEASHARGKAPVVVHVEGPAQVQPGSELTLRVVIDRTAGSDPLDLTIELPAGAELVSGQARERITGDAKRVERTITLRLSAGVPVADVNVSVDSSGIGYGVHAKSAYRFGRPEPKLPQPPREGAPVMVRGQSVGAPIPLGD